MVFGFGRNSIRKAKKKAFASDVKRGGKILKAQEDERKRRKQEEKEKKAEEKRQKQLRVLRQKTEITRG